jgi:hypothetical protein
VARYDGKPTPGYQPTLELSLRKDKEGGDLSDRVTPTWQALALRQNELLVLVHGFNNHQGEAEQAYLAFRRKQRSRIESESRQDAFEDRLGDLFWPGDANWPGVIDKVDFLVYPKAVTVAGQAGPLLMNYLMTRTDDVLVVHFLAHSLGCRLVLETIRALSSAGGPKIGKVCLMAAAVPTFKVCPAGGELFDALSAPEHLLVLFSPADNVLHWTFPPGQTLARGDEGFFPVAVGRHGDIPLHPGVVDREEISGADHGDYWGKNPGKPSDQSADTIANFFQFDGLTARSLSSRPLPPYQSLPTRSVGASRGIADPSE